MKSAVTLLATSMGYVVGGTSGVSNVRFSVTDSDSEGRAVAGTERVTPAEATGVAWPGRTATADAESVNVVWASRSAWFGVHVAVQVSVAEAASVPAGQVAVVTPAVVSSTATVVSGTLPVLVTWYDSVTGWPAVAYGDGVADSVTDRAGAAGPAASRTVNEVVAEWTGPLPGRTAEADDGSANDPAMMSAWVTA